MRTSSTESATTIVKLCRNREYGKSPLRRASASSFPSWTIAGGLASECGLDMTGQTIASASCQQSIGVGRRFTDFVIRSSLVIGRAEDSPSPSPPKKIGPGSGPSFVRSSTP